MQRLESISSTLVSFTSFNDKSVIGGLDFLGHNAGDSSRKKPRKQGDLLGIPASLIDQSFHI